MNKLRQVVKDHLDSTKIPLSVICRDVGVSYGVVYRFKTRGGDMESSAMVLLYEYFTGSTLLPNVNEEC